MLYLLKLLFSTLLYFLEVQQVSFFLTYEVPTIMVFIQSLALYLSAKYYPFFFVHTHISSADMQFTMSTKACLKNISQFQYLIKNCLQSSVQYTHMYHKQTMTLSLSYNTLSTVSAQRIVLSPLKPPVLFVETAFLT